MAVRGGPPPGGSQERQPGEPGGSRPAQSSTGAATTSPAASASVAGASGPSGLSLPAVSLPKGGGAIRGIGEKFSTNAVTGTASLSIPLATSPGRSGFGPELSLSYDSGRGNGPFGFGWSLSTPSVTRKTDKGLPRYDDGAESDVFLLSDAEDLVPARDPHRDWARRSEDEPPHAPGYRVDRYRPRVEGLFARIERWTRLADGDTHWRSVTKDNVTTWYGEDPGSRIADADDPARVFSWLVSRTYDDKGNVVVYEYAADNGEGVDTAQAHERHRSEAARATKRFLKRILYGNRVSRLVDPALEQASWMFEVVFDYGDHDLEAPTPRPSQPWPARPDPFSSYRAGFEVRTYRLCRRVLMFHHFPEEPGVGPDCLVRSTELAYRPGDAVGQFLTSVTQHGHRRVTAGEGAAGGDSDGSGTSYVTRSLPPLELEYSPAELHDEVREIDAGSLKGAPAGLAGDGYQWVDLDGEGISGLLAEQATAWFYKPNLGGGRFGPPRAVSPVPSVVGAPASGGRAPQLLDLAGNGQLDVVTLDGSSAGFFERKERGEGWEPFRAFGSVPRVDWDDPNLRFVDLNGDGHADVLLTEHDAFTWYPSQAEQGFGPAVRASVPLEAGKGPRLVLSDGTESIHLADMSGDGLTDLVRIRNGEVCYWPNLGYGRFGARVVMDHAPRFDRDEQFDQRFLRLADVDGSGPVDLIYLGHEGARIYLNHGGNAWGPAHLVATAPRTDNRAHAAAADLFGTGTTCLVWSSDRPEDARRSLRYIDLLGSTHPHLLVRQANNLGAETRVRYVSSTRFYLADKADGRPWATRLPFPVQVVERVETHDRVSGNRFVTRYAYHHGYFDGEERELRGFALVEQWDTEELAALVGDAGPEDSSPGLGEGPAFNEDAASHVPPVLTRTWFHTGAFGGRSLTRQLEAEHWHEPGLTPAQEQALLLEDTPLPGSLRLPDGTAVPHELSGAELREAVRALKGSMLRQEVYALDDTETQDRPYQVTESNYTVDLLQPRLGGDRHAVCFTYPRESVSYHYERALYDIEQPDGGVARLADPRVRHEITLDVDGYGNVLRSVAVGYGRRHPDADLDPHLPAWARDAIRDEQTRPRVTLTVNRHTGAIDNGEDHRAPLPCEVRTYELVNLVPPARQAQVTNLFSLAEMRALVDAASDGQHDLPYEDVEAVGATGSGPHRRLVEHSRTLYRRDDLSGPLPLGEAAALGLPHESYQLVLTPGLVAQVYGDDRLPDPAQVLESEGGYVADAGGSEGGTGGDSDGGSSEGWWLPSGQVFFSPEASGAAGAELAYAREHFFLPQRMLDPFGNVTTVSYDRYDLLVEESRDPLGNRLTVGERSPDGTLARHGHDYRVLQPRLVMDPNRNRSAVAFDALGMVAGTAVMGKPEEHLGDSVEGFESDPAEDAVLAYLADPLADPHSLLGWATTRLGYDLFAYWRTRDHEEPQPVVVGTLARETHDAGLGAGQVPGVQHSFAYSDGFEREVQRKLQAEPGPVDGGDGEDPGEVVAARWVGSGWTVFNNKGQPVRQYEPFFTETHQFEAGKVAGVSPILLYDPAERVVATVHPNRTFEKVMFDPWREITWDVNDMVLVSDPREDPDIGGFVQDLPEAELVPSWHDERFAGALGEQERAAADKAAIHAATPSVAYADALGRPCVTVAHNRFERDGVDGEVVEERHASRVQLDIEGNEREVVDALGRPVMRYDYDLLGNQVHQASMEAGERWALKDVAGNLLYGWDTRGHRLRTAYDELQRPTEVRLLATGGSDGDDGTSGAEVVVGRTVYGEAEPDPERLNLRGQVHQVFDTAGVVTNELYDFKGNLLRSGRRLAAEYTADPDWAGDAPLEDGAYTTETAYDALDRPVAVTAPDGSVLRYTFNEANLLERVDADLAGPAGAGNAAASTPFVTNIDYDAKGQRTLVEYGSGVRTTYDYDPLTFRLTHLRTVRGSEALQDLSYTYDPAGNITHIRDDAQQTVFFRNQVVEPHADYTYDAVYRLIAATGREHLAQAGNGQASLLPASHDDGGRVGLAHPGDGNALGRYVERFAYDEVGNVLAVQHRGHHPSEVGWTREYSYMEPSLLEQGTTSNRLSSTQVGQTTDRYEHDAHGNMVSMGHLPLMRWDHQDRLRATARQMVNEGTPETTWYVYDAEGERVRKVTERSAPAGGAASEGGSDTGGEAPASGTPRRSERIYLGGFEIHRRYGADGQTVTLERQTLHVMDGEQRIALVETRTVGEDPGPEQLIRYQLGNHLGSATLELDGEAQIISYEEYTPYGSTSYQAVRSQTEAPKRYRYTGKERDEESGFTYHGARYYAPWLARWTSPDPAGLVDGSNLYWYVLSKPTVLVDPSGNYAITTSYLDEHGQAPQRNNEPKVSTTFVDRIQDAARDVGHGLAASAAGFIQTTAHGLKDIGHGVADLLQGNVQEGLKSVGIGLARIGLQTWFDALFTTTLSLLEASHVLAGVIPVSRPLTESETKTARQVYGDTINYDAVRVRQGDARFFGKISLYGKRGDRPLVFKNTVYDSGSLDSNNTISGDATFIHEMAHVWQHQNRGINYATSSLAIEEAFSGIASADSFAVNYENKLRHNRRWESFTVEQQAELIKDAYKVGYFAGGSGDSLRQFTKSANLRRNVLLPHEIAGSLIGATMGSMSQGPERSISAVVSATISALGIR